MSRRRDLRRRERRRARRFLKKLCWDAEWRCYWCERRIVILSGLKLIVKKTARHVYWKTSDGRDRDAAIATVDHVVPLHAGGSNELDNLVAACWKCNQDRNAATRPCK